MALDEHARADVFRVDSPAQCCGIADHGEWNAVVRDDALLSRVDRGNTASRFAILTPDFQGRRPVNESQVFIKNA
jgi:hypothetical protein